MFLILTVSEVFSLWYIRELCPHPEDARSLRKNKAMSEKHQPQPPQPTQAGISLDKGPLVSLGSGALTGTGQESGPCRWPWLQGHP